MFLNHSHNGRDFLVEVEPSPNNPEILDIKNYLTLDQSRSIKASRSTLHVEMTCPNVLESDVEEYVNALFSPEAEYQAAKAKVEAFQYCECVR